MIGYYIHVNPKCSILALQPVLLFVIDMQTLSSPDSQPSTSTNNQPSKLNKTTHQTSAINVKQQPAIDFKQQLAIKCRFPCVFNLFLLHVSMHPRYYRLYRARVPTKTSPRCQFLIGLRLEKKLSVKWEKLSVT